jgi:glutamate-1-semialdehyde 2,1-aminomutase
MNTIKSSELFQMSKSYIPGGVNSPVRAFQAVQRTPVFIERAKGSKLYDVDGNEYIDYVCSWGPGILGHCESGVVNAVTEACQEGLTFGAPTEREYLLAKLIHDIMPSMELTRLVSSGTEAVMSAIRVARGYTNRDMIIKFRGCYHGHSDGLLVKAGSGALTGAMPDSRGVPFDYTKNTLIADYNNEESVECLVEQYGNRIAAIIVEPVAANMGVVLPKEGFLQFLRNITTRNGSLLIFDEVITGFRLGLGGAQEYYGVTPDLTTLGKIIGGGMPVGAYGGKREIMELVAPVGGVYQAGTLSGNPIATAAGIQTLTTLQNTPGLYNRIEEQTNKLVQAVKTRFGNTVQINHIGSLMCVFFTDRKVVDFESATTSSTDRYADYFGYMLEHGIYLAPSQFEAMFISYVHNEEDIKKTCEIISNYPL